MTKKDYIAIARVISGESETSTSSIAAISAASRGDVKAAIAYRMADMLKRDNDRFDRDRFLAACGVK